MGVSQTCQYHELDDNGNKVYECYASSTINITTGCKAGHQNLATLCDRHGVVMTQLLTGRIDALGDGYCIDCYNDDRLRVSVELIDVYTVNGITPNSYTGSYPRRWDALYGDES